MDAAMGNERRTTVDRWNGGSVDGMVERAVGEGDVDVRQTENEKTQH